MESLVLHWYKNARNWNFILLYMYWALLTLFFILFFILLFIYLFIIIIFFQSKEEDIGHHPSLYINFYCLHLPVDSVLFDEDDLKEAGIGSPIDVGDKLVEIFEKKMKQPDLALNLKSFIHREKK